MKSAKETPRHGRHKKKIQHTRRDRVGKTEQKGQERGKIQGDRGPPFCGPGRKRELCGRGGTPSPKRGKGHGEATAHGRHRTNPTKPATREDTSSIRQGTITRRRAVALYEARHIRARENTTSRHQNARETIAECSSLRSNGCVYHASCVSILVKALTDRIRKGIVLWDYGRRVLGEEAVFMKNGEKLVNDENN